MVIFIANYKLILCLTNTLPQLWMQLEFLQEI